MQSKLGLDLREIAQFNLNSVRRKDLKRGTESRSDLFTLNPTDRKLTVWHRCTDIFRLCPVELGVDESHPSPGQLSVGTTYRSVALRFDRSAPMHYIIGVVFTIRRYSPEVAIYMLNDYRILTCCDRRHLAKSDHYCWRRNNRQH